MTCICVNSTNNCTVTVTITSTHSSTTPLISALLYVNIAWWLILFIGYYYYWRWKVLNTYELKKYYANYLLYGISIGNHRSPWIGLVILTLVNFMLSCNLTYLGLYMAEINGLLATLLTRIISAIIPAILLILIIYCQARVLWDAPRNWRLRIILALILLTILAVTLVILAFELGDAAYILASIFTFILIPPLFTWALIPNRFFRMLIVSIVFLGVGVTFYVADLLPRLPLVRWWLASSPPSPSCSTTTLGHLDSTH
ncbi:hypothetical protein [Vulcanisaeta distributa]|uniref:hypothetical protein n=1 Tax=Vulcanisaeta distributa TaxID=164451 RepID=UPI001FB56BBF|nr:hypothetical protein [Vulcanisaeta distributa]